MRDENIRKFMVIVLLLAMLVVAFFLIKPILLAIITGAILAYVFNPVYKLFLKYLKFPTLSAALVLMVTILLILLPIWFIAPSAVEHTFEVYRASQQIDFLQPLIDYFPQIFVSKEFTETVSISLNSLISRTTNSLLGSLSVILLNLPTLFLQLVIMLFTFFYAMRDQGAFFGYLKSISPFSREVEKKFEEYSKGITSAVIYGQIVVGIVQGLIVGIGLFLFGVPNFLFLTLLAIIMGVLPIVGTLLVWVPAVIYLFLLGNTNAAIGMAVVGIISSSVDNILRPLLVARKTKIPSSIVLIGMVGGFLFIGIVGLIVGPLLLAYILIILELFRKKSDKVFIEFE